MNKITKEFWNCCINFCQFHPMQIEIRWKKAVPKGKHRVTALKMKLKLMNHLSMMKTTPMILTVTNNGERLMSTNNSKSSQTPFKPCKVTNQKLLKITKN
jgi:hypothetical protein